MDEQRREIRCDECARWYNKVCKTYQFPKAPEAGIPEGGRCPDFIQMRPEYDIPKPVKTQCNECKKRVEVVCSRYPKGIPFKVLVENICPEFEPKE